MHSTVRKDWSRGKGCSEAAEGGTACAVCGVVAAAAAEGGICFALASKRKRKSGPEADSPMTLPERRCTGPVAVCWLTVRSPLPPG